MLLTYLAPFILLSIYFHLQSNKLFNQSRRTHLKLIAEHQSNTLDLFLRERVVNLTNLMYNPKMKSPPFSRAMVAYLAELKKSSDTFVDIGFFDSLGVQVAYKGPFPSLENRNYSSEAWYQSLRNSPGDFIITDIYLGFRKKPHFTIGVKRIIDGCYTVLRATLDPEKIYEYITSLEGASEVYSAIVNQDGYYQVVTPQMGSFLQESSIVPPNKSRLGTERVKVNHNTYDYGYSWLKMADWALIVQWADESHPALLSGIDMTVATVSLAIILVISVIIILRARKIVLFQEESSQTKAQLAHASKLATVGELAGGIAHEINNPLAIISEEAGLVKDLMSPEYGEKITPEEIRLSLDTIQEAVFRCRDITRKLLGFVRKTDIKLATNDIHDIINDVVDGFLTREMAVSNIEIVRQFDSDLPQVMTDKNQLEQVILNIINNGVDAIEGRGKITITTSRDDDNAFISISDTGKGIAREVIDQIFLPFYTTKEVGRGTGLGLSVSYGIVKSLGGKIIVESAPGEGSTFTVALPIR